MRVLIVKFSSIGDCIMALPVASQIRRAAPDSEVVWAVDPRCAAPIGTSPVFCPAQPGIAVPARLVDEQFLIPWEAWKRERATALRRIRHYLKLREYRFDLALDLQGRAKTAICLRLCGATRRITARAYDPLPRLLSRVSGNCETHHVESNLAALRALWPLDADSRPFLPAWANVEREPGLCTIAVGSGHPAKTYSRWGEVASILVARGWSVEFLGGPGESAPAVAGTVSHVGTLSLQETYVRVAASAVHLAADTGSGHWAAAVRTPVVSIFGSHTDPRTYAPYTDRKTLLRATGHPDAIEPRAIVDAAEGWR